LDILVLKLPLISLVARQIRHMSTELPTFTCKQEMQKAASKFVGEHDFRNFCKMDAANVSNYKRRITEFTISACDKRLNLHFS
jgi:tRNA U38,U39,U40 pseudouridine synthase TruA